MRRGLDEPGVIEKVPGSTRVTHVKTQDEPHLRASAFDYISPGNAVNLQ